MGINACLNLHTDVGDNSSIAPLSVVMKVPYPYRYPSPYPSPSPYPYPCLLY